MYFARKLANILADTISIDGCLFWNERVEPSRAALVDALTEKKLDGEEVEFAVSDAAYEIFCAGIDYALGFQKALRAFADGDANSLEKYIPGDGSIEPAAKRRKAVQS